MVYASVAAHLKSTAGVQNCFVNRNLKDFDDPSIAESLAKWNCKVLFSFLTGKLSTTPWRFDMSEVEDFFYDGDEMAKRLHRVVYDPLFREKQRGTFAEATMGDKPAKITNGP